MWNIMNILVLSLLGLIIVSEGQIIQNGQCPEDITLQVNFNMEQFSNGTWYEYARTGHSLGGDCSTLDFTQVGNVYTLSHKTVKQNFREDYYGTASVPAGTARLTLTIPTISSTPIDFWVWLSVADTFALIYNCENISNTQRRVYIWQLSKNYPNFDNFPNIPIVMNTTMINNLGINSNDLYEVDHSEDACYELPNIQPGQPVVLPGQCDSNITAVPNFSAANFLGVWHEIYSYYSENALGMCSRAQYSSQDGVVVDVVNSQVINQTLLTIEGYATVASPDGSGRLNVVLQVTPNATAESELIIIATDYNQWAVSYTCVNLPNNQKRVFSWIAGRSRTLTPEVQAAVDSVVNSISDLNYAYYQLTDQTNGGCFYVPDAADGPVFGGQCDLNIPVQGNFVAANYLGLWHDIESYPTPFQFGSCSNAFYSLGAVGVDVRNTQVVNETLDVMNGVAILVGDEAKLVVSFPIAGTNLSTSTDYWVISTDYLTYSLVYTCRNINDYQQQIFMWKLSRTKSLTPAANNAITNALATQAVFDERFFQSMDQSREGCFYYPEPAPGRPVVFPGQCNDENIPVVSNFNFNLFAGQWFEVQAYPKEFQPGGCVSHQFSIASNSALNLVSTSVADQLLEITSSQLTLISGTDARFTLSITSNGTNIQFPYYIVDTDYFNYALAYSCVNLDNDNRGIYSWKLSRSQVLTNSSLSAIDNAMEPITVLSEDYFEPVDQSELGCFYFPDLAPGEPVVLPGQCDSDSVIPVMTNFDAASYLGRWRLIESYPSAFQVGSCNQAQYSLADDGTVIVYNTEVVNQTLSEATGVAILTLDSNNQTTGKLQVTFPNSTVPFDLWVLDTDYINYSLVYGCVNLNNQQRQVLSWKMSRTTSLTSGAIAAINAVTSNVIVLNNRYYQPVDHSDAACFYYPDLDPNSSVIFPGQCDETINVVTNFDAVGYMGLWHDIERYPALFQSGSCGNAFYTLLDGPVVDVFNTEVLNQTLDTIRGSAVLDLVDANDTSAKLIVNFPVGGSNASTPYWVLATDYISYALVYSCTNIGLERRSVTSWKLGRTKTLSATAVAAINQVVNSIDVLSDNYYLLQDQSPEGCFYFPEPQPGEPVVFPGLCDVNANVMQNFNLTAFQGIWHEIEAYPKEQEGGQCINHQFTVTGTNAMNFASSNVIAQSLGITSGTVRSAFNDNTGRFFLDFISNGTLITIPYWIIDTDYENYALAYSCVNQGNDFRGVWSWKLSRTKELSNTSRNAIDEAITGNVVLDNKYYEPISQADDACFYLPDINSGEPIIFPGQCDTNIRGVPNFNAAGYLGLWRTIESYPSDFQLGTCGDAFYSLNANGTVDVFNTEVINQTLSTINGIAVASADGTGQLLVTFPDAPFSSDYFILATDYVNYALVYSCFNINSEQRRVYSWKLSRTNTLSPAAVTAINQVVNSIDVLNEQYYESQDRSYSGCFYYPESDGSSSIIFRGQCNENIPVVTNFDAVAYMGLWYDIERYPATFQNGSCGNAFYTLLDGPVVDVFNTEVINQTLDTIRGSAVLDQVDANDTSAKLIVNFPVGGSNLMTSYWVLATDYISYALVYSCTNLDEYYKSVASWKLSRTKVLSPTAVTVINQVVNSIDVLNDDYYVLQDQTPEGCFYFPEARPGEPVVFPGQCDGNLNVVENFNLSRFAGRWHEIEAYPKEEQTGQCISHEFTLNANNNLEFESYNVIAQSLGITSGTVRVTSTDNSARLELIFVSNETTITIPYWIVDTDYDNYAVAYSCVNQGNAYRGVWSWKLSRTKELSSQSIAAINIATAGIDVLDDIYYEPISQSDESCFYYPVLSPGEPIIFPGQCNTNIAGVPNFDAISYLGTWYMIESYVSGFQLGECGDATYTLNQNGTVDVFNTEVINQTLSTINGLAVASDDGTGQLLVTFPDAPVPSDYYILATDYLNYALVYSCFNINSDQRRVYSWKLSRTDSLSASSEAAINAAVSQVDVLDPRYYTAVSRSDESCFYFPEPNGRTVIFRGQCDDNIDVVMGFDAERYAGVWYDIESYPAPFQGGSCGTANYDLDLDTLVVAVENTQVIDPDGFGPVLDVQTGTAVLALNDTSAKLLVTFDVNGAIVSSNYWVLATDYDNYAIVYSCQNLNTRQRQVNSWKLSRARNLTAAAETAITAAIDRVQVLQQQYFEPNGQSEEDCFFYPDNNGGDVLLDGLCVPDEDVPAVTNFNANAFSGTWHEVARFPSDLQEGECTATQYSVAGDNTILITQTEVNDELESSNVIPGSLAADGRGVINANITGIPFNTFYVMDTDYTEYALVYGCRNIGNDTKQVYSWKFSRERSGLSAAANSRIDEQVRNNMDLFENYFSYTDQSNDACFHYPEFEELPEVIDMPGPCDESIRGVANFDAAAYLGRWIEIERYPQPNQFGTCDRAYYSLGEDNVLVRNTQVINETLAEQLGFAEVASNDNSGLLNVTFVVNGVTVHANYYIIDTDYVDYALVYSCRNLANGRRQVSSWKLSRTLTLSAQANASINAAINQTQGLSQQYYLTTDQSEDGCFYVPEVNENQAPVFRGQCDSSVVGVANFNAGAFAGWWHEIERYPVNSYRGECISSQYQVSGSAYLVTDTVVANGTAAVSSGNVEVLSDGRLRRTIDGQVQDIWVVATDYNTYALLYSCETIDSEYIRVWSAKHSKTRQLTSAAQSAMAPVIESNRWLYPQFYQAVNQSDAACFHYPELTGQQVILPGQCDDNIPVVQNFDVEAYGGTWYQIERYPQIHENSSSTCIGARYTLDAASGIVTVLNWEVLDGELLTIEGNATLASTDGSAKLSVVLPVLGSPTNETVATSLYVLLTDYENHALAYSCSNINAFQRSVGAWKLSRYRTMSSASNAAITTYMASRDELYQPYFLSVEQDEDCTEPSSGTFLRSSIIVMVICALWQILS